MKIRDIIRILVIKTNSYWPFSFLNKIPYYLAIRVFVLVCKKFPEIKSVYLRHGLLQSNWVPGISDIDLTVIIDSKIELDKEYDFLELFWRKFVVLKKLLPKLGEVDILKHEHISSWTKFTIRGYESRYWKLIYGIETVKSNYSASQERLAIDSLDYALTNYIGNFLLKFYGNKKPDFLMLKELQRLTEKICKYASKYNTETDENRLDSRKYNSKTDLLCFIIKILELSIKHLSTSNFEYIPEKDDKNWSKNHNSHDTHFQSQLSDLQELITRHQQIESIILSDLSNFVVLKDELDTFEIKDCIQGVQNVIADIKYRPVIISSTIFKYMLRYYAPQMCIHLTTKRTLCFGRNLLSDTKRPKKSSFAKTMLDQLINILTFPQSQKLFLTVGNTWFEETKIDTYLDRILSLKLYLEKRFIRQDYDEFQAESRKQYPYYYEKIEELKKNANKNRIGSYSIEWFRILKDMANDIHNSLLHSRIAEDLFNTEHEDILKKEAKIRQF